MQIGFNEWQKALEDLAEEKAEIVPKGWSSCAELAKDFNCCPNHVRSKMRDLVAAEKAERRKFNREYYYRLVKKKN